MTLTFFRHSCDLSNEDKNNPSTQVTHTLQSPIAGIDLKALFAWSTNNKAIWSKKSSGTSKEKSKKTVECMPEKKITFQNMIGITEF